MIRTVIQEWDDEHGDCYVCGAPAAFLAPDLYRREDGSNADRPVNEANIFCAVCAVQHACDGERIMRLWVDDIDRPVNADHERFLDELGIEWREWMCER